MTTKTNHINDKLTQTEFLSWSPMTQDAVIELFRCHQTMIHLAHNNYEVGDWRAPKYDNVVELVEAINRFTSFTSQYCNGFDLCVLVITHGLLRHQYGSADHDRLMGCLWDILQGDPKGYQPNCSIVGRNLTAVFEAEFNF